MKTEKIIENRELLINNQKINYELRSSRRARFLRLAIYGDGRVVVTKPWRLNESLVEHFLKQKAGWIIKKIGTASKLENPNLGRDNKKHFSENKALALNVIKEKIIFLNGEYGFKYNRVSVRNQLTRWGSCSRRGNLNFNYKILFLKPELADYIIVHELCHLKEFNHSKKFWAQVGKTIPDHKERRRELRETRLSLF